MEHAKQPLDLRTLMLLVVEHDVPWDNVMKLIAEEVNVPYERLKTVLTQQRGAAVRAEKIEPVSPIITERIQPPLSIIEESSKRSYSRWEEGRLDELIARWNDGQKPGQIAKEMGVSTQTVYQKISKLRKTRTDIKSRHSYNPAFASSKGREKVDA